MHGLSASSLLHQIKPPAIYTLYAPERADVTNGPARIHTLYQRMVHSRHSILFLMLC